LDQNRVCYYEIVGGQSDEINTDEEPEDDDLMILTVKDIRNLDISLAIATSL